eukprot:c18757_g1_i1 orf=554-1048(+)
MHPYHFERDSPITQCRHPVMPNQPLLEKGTLSKPYKRNAMRNIMTSLLFRRFGRLFSACLEPWCLSLGTLRSGRFGFNPLQWMSVEVRPVRYNNQQDHENGTSVGHHHDAEGRHRKSHHKRHQSREDQRILQDLIHKLLPLPIHDATFRNDQKIPLRKPKKRWP